MAGLSAYLCDVNESKMEKENKNKLVRIIATAVLLSGAVAVERTLGLKTWQLLLVYLVPYLLIGYDILLEGAEGLIEGEPLDEDFLMGIATIGARSEEHTSELQSR